MNYGLLIFIMLCGYTLLFSVLLATVLKKEYANRYVLAKGIQSAAFVVIFAIAAWVSGRMHTFVLMLPAFLFCMSGDILMGFYNRTRKRIYFLSGLFLFLAGHVCFVRSLCRKQQLEWVDFIIPIGAVLLTYGIIYFKKLHTGKLKIWILIYSFFVAMLFGKSLHLFLAEPVLSHAVMGLGAFLFLVSDISILFLYFFKNKGKGVHVFNLVTYYYGIVLLAVSPLF